MWCDHARTHLHIFVQVYMPVAHSLALKIGELIIDRIIKNKKLKQAMIDWVEKQQSKGSESARLSAQYDRLLKKYKERPRS